MTIENRYTENSHTIIRSFTGTAYLSVMNSDGAKWNERKHWSEHVVDHHHPIMHSSVGQHHMTMGLGYGLIPSRSGEGLPSEELRLPSYLLFTFIILPTSAKWTLMILRSKVRASRCRGQHPILCLSRGSCLARTSIAPREFRCFADR
jgi:hypothetical protein